jgi:hypothetical protein
MYAMALAAMLLATFWWRRHAGQLASETKVAMRLSLIASLLSLQVPVAIAAVLLLA